MTMLRLLYYIPLFSAICSVVTPLSAAQPVLPSVKPLIDGPSRLITNPAGSIQTTPAILQLPDTASSTYSQTVKSDGPIAYWRLGESGGNIALDEIGSSDGTLLNGVSFGHAGAVLNDPNSAARFVAARSSRIQVPFTKTLNPARFTVEVWAKVTGGAGYRSPLTSRGDGPQSGYLFYAEPDNTWQFSVGTTQPVTWTTVKGPAVQLNTYTYLVGSYDGTNVSFYVNGVLSGRRKAIFAPNPAYPLRIGGGATEGPGNFFFEGYVDEIAIYDRALSDQQVLAHYLAAIPQTTARSSLSNRALSFHLRVAT
jgi:hypothetical protein